MGDYFGQRSMMYIINTDSHYGVNTSQIFRIREKTVYERDSENKRKRKKIIDETQRDYFLYVYCGIDEFIACVERIGDFYYVYDGQEYKKDRKLLFKVKEGYEIRDILERIAGEHYIKRYGTTRPAYSTYGKTQKRLTANEKCEFYEEFRRHNMSIEDFEKIILENKRLKKENQEFRDIFLTISKNKKVSKKINEIAGD